MTIHNWQELEDWLREIKLDDIVVSTWSETGNLVGIDFRSDVIEFEGEEKW